MCGMHGGEGIAYSYCLCLAFIYFTKLSFILLASGMKYLFPVFFLCCYLKEIATAIMVNTFICRAFVCKPIRCKFDRQIYQNLPTHSADKGTVGKYHFTIIRTQSTIIKALNKMGLKKALDLMSRQGVTTILALTYISLGCVGVCVFWHSTK